MGNVHFALILTTLAGLSTVLGAMTIFWFKHTNTRLLSFGLGLSAGVMIYLSFFELLKESNRLIGIVSNSDYNWIVIAAFFGGMGVTAIVDAFTHKQVETCALADPITGCKNNFECAKCVNKKIDHKKVLARAGFFTALIIALHNFPEGMVTYATSSVSLVFGISIAIAIAIHNIPEGLCVALPIYYSTGKRSKAIQYAFVAGLAEPVGALIGILILGTKINNFVLGIVLAAIAGVMVYISFDELLPTARRLDHGHNGIAGLFVGMIVIALSLYLLH